MTFKTKLAASLVALGTVASPALAHGGPPSGLPGGAPMGRGPANHPARSHKCKPHKVAFVARGSLVSQSLTKNSDGTYSGDLTVNVARTNHHAAGDRGHQVTYTLDQARVTFGLADANNDGSVGLDDLAAGDRVGVLGKVTALAKRCDHTGLTPTTTIRRVVFNAPPSHS
jgi:hypothetical protein